jgi:hypothetical protein
MTVGAARSRATEEPMDKKARFNPKARFNLVYVLIAASGVILAHDLWARSQTVAVIPYNLRTIWSLAEEAAERAMRGEESTANEYQLAEEAGEKHRVEPSLDIAGASDLAGG